MRRELLEEHREGTGLNGLVGQALHTARCEERVVLRLEAENCLKEMRVICVQLSSCSSLMASPKCAVLCLQQLLIQCVVSLVMSVCTMKNQKPHGWPSNFFFSYLLPQYFIFLLNSQHPRNLRAAFLLLCSWADTSDLPPQLYLSLKGFCAGPPKILHVQISLWREAFGDPEQV